MIGKKVVTSSTQTYTDVQRTRPLVYRPRRQTVPIFNHIGGHQRQRKYLQKTFQPRANNGSNPSWTRIVSEYSVKELKGEPISEKWKVPGSA